MASPLSYQSTVTPSATVDGPERYVPGMAAGSKVVRRSCAVALLLVALAAGCGDDDSGAVAAIDETTSTTVPGPSSTEVSDTTDAPSAAPAVLEFRPVLAQLPPGGIPDEAGEGCPLAEDWAADRPGRAPQLERGNQVACFELGPAGLGTDSVESATAVEDGMGNWVLALTLTSEAIADFNALAKECFDGAATCPTRQLAIVIDRNVLSAPSINAPEFERDAISISGGFTQAEAEALAARLG